ncbi:MAG: histidinol-phosphatase [Oscillospiraceae bacterium]|nr:histidinol-phosphatase [Oscillospiraceae bacterium]
MIANYHTHTPRCHHATGAEREYIETAIAAGIQTLGFSDHTPMLFSGGYYSTMRMYPDETAGYFETLLALREEYRRDIQILIGFETEYYPALFADYLHFLSQFPVQYLILGQHFLGNEIGYPYVAQETDREEDLRLYVRQCSQALDTGRFTYFAHPDVLNFVGSEALYHEQMTRLCRKALETETPLELNMLGFSADRHYPNPRFWQIAGEVGCKAVIGCDAHTPAALVDAAAEEACRALAARSGVSILDTVPLRNPVFAS